MARKSKEPKIEKPNGTHEPLLNGAIAEEVPAATQMSFREANSSMEKEISDFRDYIVAKYSMYQGHNLHSKVAWYLEQMGIGVAFEIEKLNLKNRQERAKQK